MKYSVLFFLLAISIPRLVSATAQLDSMLLRGDSSIAIAWTPDSVNTRAEWYTTNGSGCNGTDSIYRHCDFLPGVTYHSIAYSYGGEDGYLLFREKIDSGFVIGSHLCHYNTFGDPSSAVAGADCSGFVCYLWDVPRVSTWELHSRYTVISRDELATGDILVKPGSHAVVIIEHDEDTRFLIWESTSVVNGCRERIIDISDSYWDAYAPRRYKGLTMHSRVPRQAITARTGPVVSTIGNHITVWSAQTWIGNLSSFTIDGKQLLSLDVALAAKKTFILPVSSISGIQVIKMRSHKGRTSSIKISCITK